jgi:hypothetical protein
MPVCVFDSVLEDVNLLGVVMVGVVSGLRGTRDLLKGGGIVFDDLVIILARYR